MEPRVQANRAPPPRPPCQAWPRQQTWAANVCGVELAWLEVKLQQEGPETKTQRSTE